MKFLPQALGLLFGFALAIAIGAENSLANLPALNAADAKAAVPPVRYVSPFKDYKSLSETKITPWKPANDLTQQIGGWRAYLKEAAQPDAVEPSPSMEKPAAPQAPATTPKPDPHSGHKH